MSKSGPTRSTPTSLDNARPEQALCLAVILHALDDLNSKDEEARFEAKEFFMQPKGPWAESRRFFFSAVQIDDEWIREEVMKRYEPEERPDKQWTYLEIAETAPKDRSFTKQDVCDWTGLNRVEVNSRLQHCVQRGLLVKPTKGYWCKPEFAETAQQQLLDKAYADQPLRDRVLTALYAGETTIRELGFRFDGEVGHDKIREALYRLIDQGLVQREGPMFSRVLETAG